MAQEQQKREGHDPLAERGRLVDSAKGMYEMPRGQCQRAWESEKAGTQWLNVGAS